MAEYAPGDIVLVDWRGDALPKEANKLRPCVVVEDGELFDERHPTVIVVPLTTDVSMVVSDLATEVLPDASNGCASTTYAVSHAVVTASKKRVKRETGKRVTATQLTSIRRQIAESIGI